MNSSSIHRGRIVSSGHAALAATMVAIGVPGVVRGFTPTWSGVPREFPRAWHWPISAPSSHCYPAWTALRAQPSSPPRVLLTSFLLWLLLVRLPLIVRAPAASGAQASGDTAVMAAAAWVLYIWFARGCDRERSRFRPRRQGSSSQGLTV